LSYGPTSVRWYRTRAISGIGTLRPMTEDVDPARLASLTCRDVDAATEPLPAREVSRLAAGLDPAWQVLDDRLVREFRLTTFGAAFALATRIALLAETQGHHPAMEVAWGRLSVTWTTDAIGGLTVNDLIMAAKVDRSVARGLGLKDG
jgi:4a-hydroxytetrahydrobiopterin dehydratase